MKIDPQTTSEADKELLFVLTPSDSVQRKIASLKKEAEHLLGYSYKSRHAQGHIPLSYHITSQPSRLLWSISEKVDTVKPFNLYIKDCNTLRHGTNRSIYLDIVNKQEVENLTEKFVDVGDVVGDVVEKPHVTIARDLEYDEFLRTWPYFENLHYSQCFYCDCITVLERSGNRWIPYDTIPLAG